MSPRHHTPGQKAGRPDHEKPSITRRSTAVVAVLVFLACLYPPVSNVALQGVKAAFGYLAADSFYYMVIAKNTAAGAFSSYDGELMTNGYHPLWQFLLMGFYGVLPPIQGVQLSVTLWLSVLLVGLGTSLGAVGVYVRTRSAVAALWLVPGLLHVLFDISAITTLDPGVTYTHSTWAFMNGLESPLSIFFAGLLLYVVLTGRAQSSTLLGGTNARITLLIGILAALMILTRLDDVFLLPALFVASVWRRNSPTRAVSDVLLTCGPAAAGLLAYLAFNLVAVGAMMPVTGQAKTAFVLIENLRFLVGDYLPILTDAVAYPSSHWVYTLQRTTPILIPSVIVIIAFKLARRPDPSMRPERERIVPLLVLLIYVLSKAAYNLTFVPLLRQGYWYFAATVFFVNVVFVFALNALLSSRLHPVVKKASLPVWICVFLFSSANAVHRVGEPNWWSDVWEQRGALRTALHRIDAEPRIVDCYDGLFAFSLDVPAMPVTGLAVDPAASKAFQSGTYPELVLSRGFDIAVWLPGRSYLPFGVRPSGTELLYRNKETRVVFSRIRAPGSPPR